MSTKGTNTVTSTAAPPPEYQAAYTNLVNAGTQLAQQPLQQYGGSEVAGFTPDQQQAFSTVQNAQGMSQPYYDAASQLAGDAAAPITVQGGLSADATQAALATGAGYTMAAGDTNIAGAAAPGLGAASANAANAYNALDPSLVNAGLATGSQALGAASSANSAYNPALVGASLDTSSGAIGQAANAYNALNPALVGGALSYGQQAVNASDSGQGNVNPALLGSSLGYGAGAVGAANSAPGVNQGLVSAGLGSALDANSAAAGAAGALNTGQVNQGLAQGQAAVNAAGSVPTSLDPSLVNSGLAASQGAQGAAASASGVLDQGLVSQGLGAANNASSAYNPSLVNQALGSANTDVYGSLPQVNASTISQYENPYTSDVVDSTQAQFNNQNAQAQQQLAGNIMSAGAWGGDRSAIAQSELANQQQLAQAPVIANLESQGYTSALGEANTQQQLQATTEGQQAALGAQTGLSAAQLQSSSGLSAAQLQSQAALQAAGLGASTGLSAAQLQAQTGLQTASQNESLAQAQGQQALGAGSLQAQTGLGAGSQTLQAAGLGAQTGLSAAQLAASTGLGTASQYQNAAQLEASTGLSQAQLAATTGLGAGSQALSAAQLQAQQGLGEQQLQSQSALGAQAGALQAAGLGASTDLSAAQLGTNAALGVGAQGLTAAQLQASTGLSAAQLGASTALGVGNQDLQGAGLGAQYGLAASQLGAQTGLSSAQISSTDADQQAALQQQTASQLLGLGSGQQQLGLAAQTGTNASALNASQALGNLGTESENSALAGASSELQTGALQQQLAQEQLNVPYEQFQAQQAYPYQSLNFLSGLTTGAGSLAGGTSSTTSPAPSAVSQLGGLGLAGLGAYNAGLFGAVGAGATDAAALAGSTAGGLGDLGLLGEGLALAKRGGRIHRAVGGGLNALADQDAANAGVEPLSDMISIELAKRGGQVGLASGGTSGSGGGVLSHVSQDLSSFLGMPAKLSLGSHGAAAASASPSINLNSTETPYVSPAGLGAANAAAAPPLPVASGAAPSYITGARGIQIPQYGQAMFAPPQGGSWYNPLPQVTNSSPPIVTPQNAAFAGISPINYTPSSSTSGSSDTGSTLGGLGALGALALFLKSGGRVHLADGGSSDGDDEDTSSNDYLMNEVPAAAATAISDAGLGAGRNTDRLATRDEIPPSMAAGLGAAQGQAPQASQSGHGFNYTPAKPDMNMALIQAGLGIAGGTSPNALTNVARGAQQGMQYYEHELDKDDHPTVDNSGQNVMVYYPSERKWIDTGIPTEASLRTTSDIDFRNAQEKHYEATETQQNTNAANAQTRADATNTLAQSRLDEVTRHNQALESQAQANAARQHYQYQPGEATDPNDPTKTIKGSYRFDTNGQEPAQFLPGVVQSAKPAAVGIDTNDPAFKARVHGIANYQIPSGGTFGSNTPYATALQGAVLAENPNYDGSQFNQRNAAVTAFGPGHQAGDATKAVGVAMDHISVLSQYMTALNNGNVRLANSLKNEFANQFGVPAPATVDALRPIVGQEIVKAIVPRGGGQSEREQAARPWSNATTPGQQQAVLDSTGQLLAGQMAGLERQYAATGLNNFRTERLSPHAAALLNKYYPMAAPTGQQTNFAPFSQSLPGSAVAPGAGTAPQTQARAPSVGTVEGGYKFKGGNPADPNSWAKVP